LRANGGSVRVRQRDREGERERVTPPSANKVKSDAHQPDACNLSKCVRFARMNAYFKLVSPSPLSHSTARFLLGMATRGLETHSDGPGKHALAG